MGVVPNLMQTDQLIRESIRRLGFRYIETVLLLETQSVVNVRSIRCQLMVVKVQMAGHRVDRCES